MSILTALRARLTFRRLRAPALLALAGTAALALSACGGSHHSKTVAVPAPKPAREAVRRVGPETIFEDGLLLGTAPEATLDQLKTLGVGRVKVFLPWASVAPDGSSATRPSFDATDPGAYPAGNWLRYDTIVRDAAARGIGVDLTLSTPPLWAAGPGNPKPAAAHPQWRPSPTEFEKFVRAVATRYSGTYTPAGASAALPRVSMWSIWNEPNYGVDLAPQAISHSTVEVAPALYRGLVDAAWTALHATGHGHDTILIGETAPRGQTVGDVPGNFAGMVPLRFLRALYCVDSSLHPLRGAAAAARDCPTTTAASESFRSAHPGLFEASGFAAHLYPLGGQPPNTVIADEPDYADLASLPKLEQTLDTMVAAYGSSTHFKIYSTEFGYQTDPPEKLLHTTDPGTAAIYLNWSEYLHWSDPRVMSYDQYLLADPPRANASGGFASGLEFKDHTPKATYAAFRMPVFLPVRTFSAGTPVEVWGCVRPAHYLMLGHHTPQRVEIQFARSGGRYRTVRTVTLTDRYGYFDVRQGFAASGSVRLAWRYPSGQQIFSLSVAVTVR